MLPPFLTQHLGGIFKVTLFFFFCCFTTISSYIPGNRWGRPTPSEKRDDDEVPGIEAGTSPQTLLPHRQAQAEPVVSRVLDRLVNF